MTSDRCATCGSLTGHEPIGAAECALTAAHRADLASIVAPDDRTFRVQVLDLYAHLRGVFPSSDAHRATRYVLELGWRPKLLASSDDDEGVGS